MRSLICRLHVPTLQAQRTLLHIHVQATNHVGRERANAHRVLGTHLPSQHDPLQHGLLFNRDVLGKLDVSFQCRGWRGFARQLALC